MNSVPLPSPPLRLGKYSDFILQLTEEVNGSHVFFSDFFESHFKGKDPLSVLICPQATAPRTMKDKYLLTYHKETNSRLL